MKLFTRLIVLVSIVMALGAPAFAQSATTQTVLAASVAQTDQCITVASATGFSASTQTVTYMAWFDGELMKVNTVTGTRICGTRGYLKTRQVSHPTAQVVWFGQAGLSANGIGYPFTSDSPVPGSGCTSTQYGRLPIINYTNGTLYNCLTSAQGGTWIGFNYQQWAYGHPLVAVNDAAYTASLSDEYIVYTNVLSSRIMTMPSITGVLGKTLIVKHSGTSGNTVVVTAVNNQFLGTTGTTSITLNHSQSTKLLSVKNLAGAWGWVTID